MPEWRPIPNVRYDIDIESEDAVRKAFLRITLCLNLALEETFAGTKYKKFAILCSTIDEDGKPTFELTCHEVEFMSNFERFMDGYYSKEDAENKVNSMVDKFTRVIDKFHIERLFAASVVYDEQAKIISLGETPLHMEITTTSGLLFHISNMVNSHFIVDPDGLIFEHYPLTKFIAFNLDTDRIDVSKIRINVDNYEDWDFYYPEYEREVEERRMRLQEAFEEMIEDEEIKIMQIETPGNMNEFKAIIEEIIMDFRKVVETEGYKLLHDDNGQPRDESICQTLFNVHLKKYCKMKGIDLTKEPETGRGPVDFRFSDGVDYVAHIEIKKDANPKLEHGLEKQLPTYMEADEVNVGFMIIFDFGEKDIDSVVDRMNEEKVQLMDSKGLMIEIIRIDSRQKASASKV